MTVGFIGTGSMGGQMVERLLAVHAAVRVYARRPESVARFTQLGATCDTSIARLAERCDVIVVCPFSEDQVFEICTGPDGVFASARPDSIVVQHATISIEAIEHLAALGAERAATVLDAPISGRAEDIRTGDLTVLLGGDDHAARQIDATLRAYAGTIVRTGAVGTATAAKLVNNVVFAAHVQVAGAALDLGAAFGLTPADVFAALSACSARSFALTVLQGTGDAATFAERGAPYLRKDIVLVEQAARDRGVSLGVLAATVRDGPFELGGS
jgi:3-hydroxyisobutyrate dehydrogenase-like beta-hydroxyacid dehydrogenase